MSSVIRKNSVFGLIPARGGSKGLQGKHTRLLLGQPLISYIIRAAKGSRQLERLFVSTDSAEIAAVAQQLGAEVIRHPPELSTDTASTFGVVQNALTVFKSSLSSPSIVVTMRATSPLCRSEDVDRAVALLLKHPRADSVISVVKSSVHPYRLLAITPEGYLKRYDEDSPETDFPHQRQTFPDVYIRNGAIYATRARIIERGSLWGQRCLPFIMPRERSVNINDNVDFVLAETLMREMK